MSAPDAQPGGDIFALDGRVAIVTGASGSLGERYCRVLAGQGATVVAAARRLQRLEALAGEVDGIVPVGCDVADDSQLERLVEVAVAHGGPDIVVNNAGVTDAVVRAHEQDPDQFRRVLDINLTAAFVLSAAAARQDDRARPGRQHRQRGVDAGDRWPPAAITRPATSPPRAV